MNVRTGEIAAVWLGRKSLRSYTQSMNTELLDQARKLSVDEQIELVEALWDNIVERNAVPPLTKAQVAELDARIADYEANPDDVGSWDEVKAEALKRIGK
jgi:putative addiction module component (TIGR02574 family)